MLKKKALAPWKKKGKPRVIVEKYGKRFYEQKFINPKSGSIVRFAMFSQRDWSLVFPLTTDGKVLYVKEYKQGAHKIVTELPAGTADFKRENPRKVIERELLEETGYACEKIIALGTFHMNARSSETRAHAFLALGCRYIGGEKNDENEDVCAGFVSLKKWLDMIFRGEVRDPYSIAATLLALKRLGEK